MDKHKRLILYSEADKWMEDYCRGCFLHKYFSKEKGRRYAHNFCINKCTVGERLRKIGQELENSSGK
ncbi:MAG: zinc-finger domain-containing protein [Caldibacillus debilis]|uniref:Zinc-finger domain-containing protein n=3 Tax=Caldibacillus debilis TaxID=301148 RepID=A0A420VBE9_9BACI|nr:zinc-finger domain-containing protein [Caldibacillus debilis]MBO2482531.1 zinc-finger domain-containing protein [Bacillaceae bacterium]MBY6273430.1 zinc-finger domain-containing protein [Bacillaceae bacterium]OUM92104.1 MAG: hypothetical protein BAA03_12290 [Caldibacillus debilis]REJ18314.1 MAG: zinc-finger domain-containing protein [Caldibacillus debilis]REJ24452.1 MAG: zinc-finger domain-containing protein [Caldibacillus debilis]